MIRIDNVTKKFGRARAVDAVSLDLDPGDSVALWGANGAGKTTLIRCVLGLLRFRGTISVAGHDVRRRGKKARLMIGYVPQELGFYDDLGVAEAIRFFGRLKGVHRPDSESALASVGLAGQGEKRIRELSGGMKQRLALAIALIGDPSVLVLDEVTASLDAVGREEFVRLLEQLSSSGRTVLFASHRIDEVAALAKRVAVLERGRLTRVVACREFALDQAGDTVLHLAIPRPSRDRAIDSLRACGFMPQLNGIGVLVPVAPENKAAPFRVLAEAKVSIENFEVMSPGRAAAIAAAHVEEEKP